MLLGTVRASGPHKFVVHYYLPYNVGSELSVVVHANGQEYKGTLNVTKILAPEKSAVLIPKFEQCGAERIANYVDPDHTAP